MTIVLACAIAVFYAYVGYPLALVMRCALRRSTRRVRGREPASVAIVLAAQNEESAIGRRVRELRAALAGAPVRGQLIVVSDGSTDETARIARENADENVKVIELTRNIGKAAALSAGCALTSAEIVVFADARQTWQSDALNSLLMNFADPSVGAVSGELVLHQASGVLGGVGLYWRYEKWIRAKESQFNSMVSVTGAICAVRKELLQKLPEGIIVDDMWWPMHVALGGHRVVFDSAAVAFDRLPDSARDEFRRKVRTLSGNFQLIQYMPTLLLPWRNPVWWQFVSHKVLRLAVPWALACILIICAVHQGSHFLRALLWTQVIVYGIGVGGMCGMLRMRIASAVGAFVILNAAAWLSFWVWSSGMTGRVWRKCQYAPQEGERADSVG